MLTWEEIVQKYIIQHSKKICKITEPLRTHFGINYFTYHKIDKAGKYTVLVDRPDWAERYVESKLFLRDPYLRHPSVYESGICSIESQGSKAYKSTILKKGKEVLNSDLGILLIQKHEDYVEFFGYAANQNSSLQDLYLNQPDLLKSFALHFKKEMFPLIRQGEEEGNFLQKLKGKDFFCKQPIHPNIKKEARFSFLKQLGLFYEIEKGKSLSYREKECLTFLLENKSAKETAALLGLSRRTIEAYFENIKNKLSCWDKQEVLQMAKKFKEIGIL